MRRPGFAPPKLLVVWLILVGACEHEPELERHGGAEPGDVVRPSVPGTATWCDALAVLAAKCQRCHQDPPRNGAPFPLLRFEHTLLPRPTASAPDARVFEHVLRVVELDVMPPIARAVDPPVEPLSCDEKATLLDWLRQGVPEAGAVSEDCADPARLVTCESTAGAGGGESADGGGGGTDGGNSG